MNQKRRTRQALVDAAMPFLRRGERPGVAEVADAALVSRTTAYRYFPNQDALLSQAALDLVTRVDVEHILELQAAVPDPAAKVDVVVRADRAMTLAHEAEFRAMLSVAVQPRLDASNEVPRRPANRLRWLTAALQPLEATLSAAARRRLLAALSLCLGVEAVVVLQDVCGLPPEEAEAVSLWAAQALLRASLGDAAADGSVPPAP